MSVVDVPPSVRGPSVILGTSPVDSPREPSVPAALTRMRLAGISRLNPDGRRTRP
jgi:hypothetical protein